MAEGLLALLEAIAASQVLTFDSNDINLTYAVEPAIVRELRSRAAAQGISVEEAHRRLLRAALLGDKPGPQRNFINYLRDIPQSDAIEFPRSADLPRLFEL